ncbi:MAG: cupin domain-containing protein, partial [Alphaproteobacteria bacterium]|nr:cupin domain-containing protein [Alphaproteobacteria bacterium]
YGAYPAGIWIRSPHRSAHTPFSNEGCLIYYKTGHFLGEYGTLSDPAERVENSTMSTA